MTACLLYAKIHKNMAENLLHLMLYFSFGVKFVKNACFLKDAVLKYITVRRTSDRMKCFKNDVKRRDSTESKMNLKNLSKKRLTTYHESDKMNKLSAARLRRTGP